ncbi:odorant-binding protein [Culex quinquefasciatus]|uniref:Odorant-binding protein n=1 Tax=Culex quinquefasciatus TaxID=7176 RepID=B0WL17_CULQU|nr:odorant-binding protein [Culex quinquefasciatus]|eukprot:XP_001849401.1 odorant-binding protein [Culex quinquefasciatus]
MKFSLVLCLLPAVILAQDKLISREEETCREQEGASDEDVEMLQSFMTPETRTTKCYYSCVMQKIGYSDGQRFDKEGFLSTAVNFSSKDRETMQRIADQCEGTTNEDHCELAADIAECIIPSRRN